MNQQSYFIVILFTLFLPIVVNTAPLNVDLPATMDYCDYDSNALIVEEGVPTYSISWSPSFGLQDPNSRDPGFTMYSGLPLTYTLTVTDSVSDVASDNVIITGKVLNVGIDQDRCYTTSGPVSTTVPLDGQAIDDLYSSDDYDVTWQPATYLSDHKIPRPIATVPAGVSITYTMTLNLSDYCLLTDSITVVAERPEFTYQQSDVTCAGAADGRIYDVAIVGAYYTACWELWKDGSLMESGLTYTPIPDFNDLPAGDYQLRSTCGCTASLVPITISEPSPLTYTLPGNIAYCDLANMNWETVSGGQAPYSYSWNNRDYLDDANQAQPQFLGNMPFPQTFTSTLTDANGCTATATITVTGNTPDYVVSTVPPTCPNATDGACTISGSYQCHWPDGVESCQRNDLAVGLYQVEIIDSCQQFSYDSIRIEEPVVSDSDGDGVDDCVDMCPLDRNKIVPGICGCQMADTDADNDGYAVCEDMCDTDPSIFDQPCADSISLNTTSTEDQNNHVDDNAIISSVNIPQNRSSTSITLTKNSTKEIIEQIDVDFAPLREVDADDNVVQSLDLSEQNWRRTLRKEAGYNMLTSHMISDKYNVSLIHYFFQSNCFYQDREFNNGQVVLRRYVNIYCSEQPIVCQQDNCTTGQLFHAGDSKVNIEIPSWPWQADNNRLLCGFSYQSASGYSSEEQSELMQQLDYRLLTRSDIELSITIPDLALKNNRTASVQTVIISNGVFDIDLGHFDDLVYDPSLRYFFSPNMKAGEAAETHDWLLYYAPLTVFCSAIFASVVMIILIQYVPFLRKIVQGPEAERVRSLRRHIKSEVPSEQESIQEEKRDNIDESVEITVSSDEDDDNSVEVSASSNDVSENNSDVHITVSTDENSNDGSNQDLLEV